MLRLFTPLYFMGLLACGAQGYRNAGEFREMPTILSAAFGGGILRDGALHRSPAFLSPDTIPEIFIALLGAIIQASHVGNRCVTKLFTVADAFGVGTFLIIGVSVAQQYGCGPIAATLYGIITSLGGGVLSGLLSGLRLRDILSKNVYYRCTVIAVTVCYVSWVYLGYSPLFTQCFAILLTGICNMATSIKVRKVMRQCMKRLALTTVLNRYEVDLLIMTPNFRQRGWYIPYRAPEATRYTLQSFLCNRPRHHLLQPA